MPERSLASAFVEHQHSPVIKLHFPGLPFRPLIILLSITAGLVEPVEMGILVWDPFLDGPPGWLDASERFDVEGWRRRPGQTHQSLPQAVELQEKFDLLMLQYGPHDFHGARAARALERIATPYLDDEIAPEGAHEPGAALGRRFDEKQLALP